MEHKNSIFRCIRRYELEGWIIRSECFLASQRKEPHNLLLFLFLKSGVYPQCLRQESNK